MNKEYEELISKFYDLTTEEKKKEIYDEFSRIEEIFNIVSKFSTKPDSNSIIEYKEDNTDSEDENLTKLYNNLLIVEEKLVYFLKSRGF